MTRVASIDIGTNTVLLLVAEWEGGKVRSLFDTETTVRVGKGVHRAHLLSREAMHRGLQAITAYRERCRAMNVAEIFAVGTSALREAGNAHEFIAMITPEP
jgi:exopolyphosphatase / guanosine-5'-triphosphate,3'-diphosphate pyrophosphatase